MAFCQNCGKQIPDDTTLCEACAAPAAPAAQPEPAPVAQPEPVAVAAQPAPAAPAQPAAPVAQQPAAPYFQPAYTAPAAQPYQPVMQQPMRIPLSVDQLPPEYKPLGAWMYFLYNLLFSIPLVGFICLIVFACGGTQNINLRNYARSFFCAYLLIAIATVVIVAIVIALGASLGGMAAGSDAVNMFDMALSLFR